MTEKRKWVVTLEDDAGNTIAAHVFATDLTNYPVDEYTISKKALCLYRDLLYREGLWEDYRLKKAQWKAENDQPR